MTPARKNTTIEILENADIYGYEIVLMEMKRKFSHVSYREKSIPSSGSLCRETSALRNSNSTNVESYISHKNGNITLKTNKGFLRFINL